LILFEALSSSCSVSSVLTEETPFEGWLISSVEGVVSEFAMNVGGESRLQVRI
jgi:hypothetical protein